MQYASFDAHLEAWPQAARTDDTRGIASSDLLELQRLRDVDATVAEVCIQALRAEVDGGVIDRAADRGDVRALLLRHEQRGETRHVWRRHARSFERQDVEAGLAFRNLQARRRAGAPDYAADVSARRGDVDLAEAEVAVRSEAVLVEEGTEVAFRARRTDGRHAHRVWRAAVDLVRVRNRKILRFVARRDDDHRSLRVRVLEDAVEDLVKEVLRLFVFQVERRIRRADAHRDDVSAAGRVEHSLQHRAERAAAVHVEHLYRH